MECAFGGVVVAFVDDENVGDFEQPGFHGLNVVTEAGGGDDDPHVGHFGDVDFVLTGANGFEQHEVKGGRVEDVDNADGSRRKAAKVAAARQRADVDVGVVECRRHADAVTEDGAARYRARWVNGDDGDPLAGLAPVADEGVDEG